ncbi:sodium-independent sulfate anion transporter-like isoform 1-T1 [Glossina fuscipes fuscipes]|uniref:SLC26A/SulP transporter domain-containing protein n=2 Tax=Nemorhina TaxID=44051 RepID=A0A1B0AVC2_9MUSC
MEDFEVAEKIYNENEINICEKIKNYSQKRCTVNTMKNVFPVLVWLPKYNSKFLMSDFVAGLTVGLTAIPQAIAYATVAGLLPQYGLYSAFMGCFVYIIFGTCKDITVGPTAITALMVQSHVSGSPDYAVLCCFLSGCIILCLGLLNLGVLVRFISIPVTTGFTMAAAITIASGQINNLFGIRSTSNEFIASWYNFFTHLNEIRMNDAALGITTLIILLMMRKVKDLKCRRRYKMFTKYISLSRNALAVLVGILLCYLLRNDDRLPFKVSGEISPGLPPFEWPPFSTTVNGTIIPFKAMVSNLGASLISIPLISILESVAIAKAFSKGRLVDATQEMIALGVSNIMGGFVSSMPITGSFTRTAINNSSGVKTPLGGAVTGTLVLMALAFLTKTFYYIPKATLAAIIIGAMIFMVEYDRVAEIWRSKKIDFLPFLVTVLACLFWSLEYGIVAGILANMTFILYKSARPIIIISKEEINCVQIGIVEVMETLCYSSAEYLKYQVMHFTSSQAEGNEIKLIILKIQDNSSIDSSVALNILSLEKDLSMLECRLVCWNWNVCAAGVIYRLHSRGNQLLKYGKSYTELINDLKLSPSFITCDNEGSLN